MTRAAAPLPRRVAAQAAFEMRTVLRNGEQLVITLVLPVLLLLVLTRTSFIDLGTDDRIGLVAPGILALAVMSTAFTSQAIATGFDRRNGVLRLLATTPLGRGGLLAGKCLGVLALEVLQITVLAGVAVAMGWRPDPAGLAPAALILLLGTAAFTSFALLLAGTLRAEAVLAVANLVWVLLLAAGGVLLPVDLLPVPAGHVALLLPSGALGEALRSTLTGGGLPISSVVVLGAWTAVLGTATARLFRWS
ncbi:ABC transporter permease [Actinotalea sp. K2]|uniref:ABC transporter permease n=1 Tax=Actinotalea sp. K2 TaxID=2939438 RepID=UPI0020182590|nr:ABC transporter permease [Actinotalea sp. K2]MCL3861966.1 ABC transporter permease [Actinotalea sp. K2]